MSDIIERLIYGTQLRNYDALIELCKEAAEEIERLRAVLREIAEDGPFTNYPAVVAAAALEPKP